jgi:hypothetical protein
MSAIILKGLDEAGEDGLIGTDLAKDAATRIRVLEKGIRDGLSYLSALHDEKALEALTGALRSGYDVK